MSGRVISTRRAADSGAADGSGDSGGNVEDILKRLGNLETNGYELKSQVSAILAVVPHLATKADLMASVAELRDSVAEVRTSVADVRTSVGDLKESVADLRTSVADLRESLGDVRTSVAAVETAIIKWIVATTVATGGLAFTIAKFVHDIGFEPEPPRTPSS
jgi:uncharacterized protein YoxC